MKDLFVVTHTQSVHHTENKVGGWYDTDLTPRGRQDAEITADYLAALIGDRNVEIHSSDLRRATETATAIAKRFGCPVIQTAALREISYGVAGGKPQDWLDARYTPAPDDNRLDHNGAIEQAETRREVASRVFPCVDAIVKRDCETQIIVAHGSTLTFVIAAWLKIPIEHVGFMSFPAKPGSITHLHQDDFFKNRAVQRLADVAHFAPTREG